MQKVIPANHHYLVFFQLKCYNALKGHFYAFFRQRHMILTPIRNTLYQDPEDTERFEKGISMKPIFEEDKMSNIPMVNLGIIAVSRNCFPMSLSKRRCAAVCDAAKQKGLEIFAAETAVENELDALKALAEVKAA